MENVGTYVVRLRDAADLYGLNKRKVSIFGLPSDYICVSNNSMFFAEVKSSNNKTSVSFDCFTVAQKAAMVRCTKATDLNRYYVFFHNMNTDTWYWLSGNQIVRLIKTGKKSIKWEELCLLMSWVI